MTTTQTSEESNHCDSNLFYVCNITDFEDGKTAREVLRYMDLWFPILEKIVIKTEYFKPEVIYVEQGSRAAEI